MILALCACELKGLTFLAPMPQSKIFFGAEPQVLDLCKLLRIAFRQVHLPVHFGLIRPFSFEPLLYFCLLELEASLRGATLFVTTNLLFARLAVTIFILRTCTYLLRSHACPTFFILLPHGVFALVTLRQVIAVMVFTLFAFSAGLARVFFLFVLLLLDPANHGLALVVLECGTLLEKVTRAISHLVSLFTAQLFAFDDDAIVDSLHVPRYLDKVILWLPFAKILFLLLSPLNLRLDPVLVLKRLTVLAAQVTRHALSAVYLTAACRGVYLCRVFFRCSSLFSRILISLQPSLPL